MQLQKGSLLMPTLASRIMRVAATVVIAAAAVTVVVGCSTESQEQSQKPAAKTVAVPAPPPPPPGAAAKATVRSYYAEINAQQYAAAWSRFSSALRASQGGFSSWRAGYAHTIDTQLLSIRTVEASPSEVVEEIELAADATDACGDPVSQVFAGTWTLVIEGDSFVGSSLDVQQTGGDTLVTDSSECAPPPAPVPVTADSPPQPPEPTCDPNYAGACLDPTSSDYDCAGGSGNGPDYTGAVAVVGSDPYGLDADGDGYACE
jgi:hypothetical protein